MVSCVNENNKNENVASNELSKQTIKKAFDYENMLSEKYDNMKMNDIFKSDIPNEIWVGKTEEVDRRNRLQSKELLCCFV